MKLDKAQKSELRDLYSKDAGWSGVREMAKHFGVGFEVIRWAVNYNGYRKKHALVTMAWMKKHPKKAKEYQKKASEKYNRTHKEEIRKRHLRYYWKNRDKLRKKMREYYKKNYVNKKRLY